MNHQRMKHALEAALVVSLGGVAFSGFLTYRELVASSLACPSPGAPGTIFGYPACVYGFFMYCTLVIISAFGLTGARGEMTKAGVEGGILHPSVSR
jgi:uncharacterized membrane protein